MMCQPKETNFTMTIHLHDRSERRDIMRQLEHEHKRLMDFLDRKDAERKRADDKDDDAIEQ